MSAVLNARLSRAAQRVLALAIGAALAFVAVLAFMAIRFGPRAVSQVLGPHPHPERDYPSSAVAREIATLGDAHAWAGEYITTDGFTGEVVCVAPHSGYFRWHFWDVGPGRSDPELGDIVERDGVLHFTPTSTPDPDEGYRPSSDFIPVVWGSRHYLIASYRVDEFCRTVAARKQPYWGMWLLREGDQELPFEPDAVVHPSTLCR